MLHGQITRYHHSVQQLRQLPPDVRVHLLLVIDVVAVRGGLVEFLVLSVALLARRTLVVALVVVRIGVGHADTLRMQPFVAIITPNVQSENGPNKLCSMFSGNCVA